MKNDSKKPKTNLTKLKVKSTLIKGGKKKVDKDGLAWTWVGEK